MEVEVGHGAVRFAWGLTQIMRLSTSIHHGPIGLSSDEWVNTAFRRPGGLLGETDECGDGGADGLDWPRPSLDFLNVDLSGPSRPLLGLLGGHRDNGDGCGDERPARASHSCWPSGNSNIGAVASVCRFRRSYETRSSRERPQEGGMDERQLRQPPRHPHVLTCRLRQQRTAPRRPLRAGPPIA